MVRWNGNSSEIRAQETTEHRRKTSKWRSCRRSHRSQRVANLGSKNNPKSGWCTTGNFSTTSTTPSDSSNTGAADTPIRHKTRPKQKIEGPKRKNDEQSHVEIGEQSEQYHQGWSAERCVGQNQQLKLGSVLKQTRMRRAAEKSSRLGHMKHLASTLTKTYDETCYLVIEKLSHQHWRKWHKTI